MGLELDNLRQQNELINEQLEATRLNSDEIREQISLSRQLSQLAQINREQGLRINRTNRELSDLNKDLIDKLKERNNLSRKLSDIEKDRIKSQKISNSLETEINELIDKSRTLRGRNLQTVNKIIQGLREQKLNNDEIITSLEREYTLVDQINKKLGLAPAIAEGLGKALDKLGFGNLSKQLKLEEVVQNTRNWVAENEGNVTSFGILTKFSGGILKNIIGLLSPMNILQISVGLLVKSMIDVDKMAGETAKQFGISYGEANKINQELTKIASNSNNTFINTKSLVEAQNTLNNSLGTNNSLSGDMLITFTELTKQAGYTVEASTMLSKLSLINNKSSKELTTTYLGQVKALNAQNATSINGKKLLNDISNISKATLVTFAQNPKELAKAAFEVKKIGLELKQIEGIQNSLLNIESSIASEFEAEVMTGKSLNLERARYFALTNDISGLAQEINKQGITSEKFGKMNVLQQESYSKAIGMSRDELGGMLMEQESIRAVGAKDLGDLKKKYELVKGTAKETEFLNKLGNEDYARQLQSTTTQERFLALTEKLQEVFVSIAGPIMSIVSPIVDTLFPVLTTISGTFQYILESVSKIFGLFTGSTEQLTIWESLIGSVVISLGIAKTLQQASAMYSTIRAAAEASSIKSLAAQGVLMVKNLGVAIATAVSQMTGMSAATLGIATAIGLAGGAAAYGYLKSMDDGMVGPDGGMILSGPKGSIQLNKDDSVIAGTDLMGGQKSEGGNVSSLASSLNNKLDQLISEIRVMSGELKKGMTVNLDGNKVSQELLTPLAISNRKV